jgi:hypothetical protein
MPHVRHVGAASEAEPGERGQGLAPLRRPLAALNPHQVQPGEPPTQAQSTSSRGVLADSIINSPPPPIHTCGPHSARVTPPPVQHPHQQLLRQPLQ